MIHLEPGHRVVGETIAARFNAPADKREAVDVRAADLDDVQYHVQVAPEDRSVMHIHMWCRNFNEISEAVGDQYFSQWKAPSALSEDRAHPARLLLLTSQAAAMHPRAPPEPLGGSPWPP